MILERKDFLDASEVGALQALFDDLEARDGKRSAGDGLGDVKRNREIQLGAHAQEVKGLVLNACNRAPMLNYALLPKRVTTPFLSVYEIGMGYGIHTDSAVGDDGGHMYRTDISCTVFLDDPASYEGGALRIDTGYGAQAYKLPPGGAVFYPTLFLHEVEDVTRGRRRACVFWVESLVRDPQKRAILFDMAQLGAWVGTVEPIDSEPRQRLVQIRENLYRMWIEV